MKSIVFLIFMLSGVTSFSQNDSLLPQVYGGWFVKYSVNYPENIYFSYNFYSDTSKTFLDDTLWYNNSHGVHLIDSGRIYFKAWTGSQIDFYDFDENQTKLLYDFNIEVGDTAYINNSENSAVIVDSIGTSDFLGETRKAYFLKANNALIDVWIIGMGSVHGFFFPWAPTLEANNTLCSFEGAYLDSLNNPYTLSYDNPDICESLGEEKFEVESVRMNCSGSRITVEVNKAEELIIYSYSGQEIKRMQLHEGLNQMDISTIKSGAYIVKIGGSYTERFIKH